MEFPNVIPAILVMLLLSSVALGSDKKVYIIYMGAKQQNDTAITLSNNEQFLTSVGVSRESMLYSYHHGFRGIAAEITESQAAALAKKPGVISVFPSKPRKLQTTRSWNFLGMRTVEKFWKTPDESNNAQENVIIGMIDTGIWPESASFSDQGMSPAPSRWKGECQSGENFPSSTCNRKIIGARYFPNEYDLWKARNMTGNAGNMTGNAGNINDDMGTGSGNDFRSARDMVGHGTHTASIAAGRFVHNMNYKSLAAGDGRGGAPFARLAVYKACWNVQGGCWDADILAAFDSAIRDGVDILSVSIITQTGSTNFQDSISVGSFHAVRHGITVVCAGGNDGVQGSGSVSNTAPWIITVAASSIDRDFNNNLQFVGNQTHIRSLSLSVDRLNHSATTIRAYDAAAKGADPIWAGQCYPGSLDAAKVAGKVVLCNQDGNPFARPIDQSKCVKQAGGAGAIIFDQLNPVVEQAYAFEVPTAYMGNIDEMKVLPVFNSTKIPRVSISQAKTGFTRESSPVIAGFSSKGPNTMTPDIIKPDIAAPGLNILAAWSPAMNGTDYNIVSGTSMACPHVAGIVALIKAANPEWSPAAIKSAIVTTGITLAFSNQNFNFMFFFPTTGTNTNSANNPITRNPRGDVATPLDFGGGILNPRSAMNPGLVYDAGLEDYIALLCVSGFNAETIQIITGDKSLCPENPAPAYNLNYPSIAVSKFLGEQSLMRSLKYLGNEQSTYKAVITSPSGIQVSVTPGILTFKSNGETLNFTVTFKGPKIDPGSWKFGSLTWTNGINNVTSPIGLGGGHSD